MAASASSASDASAEQQRQAELAFGGAVFDEDEHAFGATLAGEEEEHVSDRDDAVDADVDRSAQAEAEIALAVHGGHLVEKSLSEETTAMRSAGGAHDASDSVGASIIRGSDIAVGKLIDGLVTYEAAADDASRTPIGPPPIPGKPFYLKHSHQLLRGVGYGDVVGQVVALLGGVDTKMKIRQDSGRISCHLYTPRGEWVQFKVRFYGYPSESPAEDPHFAVEFDRQQGSAFLLERVYRACMLGLQEHGIELKGQCRSAAQVLGAAPQLPASADPVAPPVMVRGSSSASTSAGTSSAESAGATGSASGASTAGEEGTASSPAEALGPLMDMMKSEWADASEEALASLARLVGEDSTGSAKAAVAARPGLIGMLLSMASGSPVGATEEASEGASGSAEMELEAAVSAARAVLRRLDEDDDGSDEAEEEDDEEDGSGYRHDDPAFDGASAVVDKAQHDAAVADLAACFMRRRVDVVRRTLAAIALQQSLSGSAEVSAAVLALPGAVAALVAASSGQEDGAEAEAAIDGAFRPAIATLRHTCIKSVEFLCDSAEGRAAVAGASAKPAMEAVARCASVDDRTRESARNVMELL